MIDFPNGPTVGQTHAISGRLWKWNGSGWERLINPNQQVAVFVETGPLVQEIAASLSFIGNAFYLVDYV